jgi:hypothetical protein
LPYVPGAAGANAALLIQFAAVCFFGYMLAGSMMFTGWFATVVSAWSVPAQTEKNCADAMDKMGANCQSLANNFRVGLENFGLSPQRSCQTLPPIDPAAVAAVLTTIAGTDTPPPSDWTNKHH